MFLSMPKSLSDDIIWEILSWLPPKPLIKFQCVSQSWYDEIVEPRFINKHLSNYCGGVDDEKEDYFPINFEATNGDYFWIWGSYDGLFCCSSNSGVYLYNPSIRWAIHLPPDPFTHQDSRISIGIGYEDASGDIKLVKIDRTNGAATIYSINKSTWEKMDNVSPDVIPHRRYADRLSIFVEGSIYWCGISALVAFDLSKKVFRQIPYPANNNIEPFNRLWGSLSIVKGSLNLMTWDRSSSILCIWEMKDDLWVNIFRIEHLLQPSKSERIPQCLSYKGSILFSESDEGTNHYKWVACDRETKQCKDLGRTLYWSLIPVKKNLRLLDLPGEYMFHK